MGAEPRPDQVSPRIASSRETGHKTVPAPDWHPQLASIHSAIAAIVSGLDSAETQSGHALAERLRASVLRPLSAVLDDLTPAGYQAGAVRDSSPADLDEQIFDLAISALSLISRPGVPAAVGEAAAGLADLALRGPQAPEQDLEVRKEKLSRVLAGISPRVVVLADGPYMATNVPQIVDWLGVPIELPAHVALCRCGVSAIKPLCDGSHARTGFTDAAAGERPPDRRDAYPGPALTVHDNRGLCSQSGLCSQRLSAVFHAGETPFVTPSAGRLDEIVRAVRECPSGALSLGIDGQEAREVVDQAGRPPRIEVSKDGPYRITGGVRLLDGQYCAVPRYAGASLEHYSLCRCGQSRNMPFCSGQHLEVHFGDPVTDRERVPTLFEWAGGFPALTRLTRRFYETYVPADPLLGPLFARMGPDHPERVAAWFAQVFGGPGVYSGQYGGFTAMMTRHLHRQFSEAQRARFVALLCRSADDVGLPADPEFRGAFVAYLEWGSRIALETSRPGARPPRNMQMPLWGWIRDAVPGSRPPSFTQHEKRPQLAVPGPGEPVRFAVHIRPQFRRMDRRAMSYAFDLWDAASVRTHAKQILARIEDGTMPVDGAWPAEAVELLRRWIASGMPD